MKKWLNVELNANEADNFKRILSLMGIKYESCGADKLIHFEVFVNDAEAKELDSYLAEDSEINRLYPLTTISLDGVKVLKEYFKKHLPNYRPVKVLRKSLHEDDNYLFVVEAMKENGEYAVWSSWNTSTESLNHGHYGMTKESADALILELINYELYPEEEVIDEEITSADLHDYMYGSTTPILA